MNTALVPPPRPTVVRPSRVTFKTISPLVSLAVTAALTGIYMNRDSFPERYARSPAPPAIVEHTISPADLAVLTELHGRRTDEFASKPGFGRRREFHLSPFVWDIPLSGSWFKVRRPDLIAVEGDPLVYVSPSIDETIGINQLTKRVSRAKIPTRPLTPTEAVGVAALQGGKQMVLLPAKVLTGARMFGRETDGYRAVGALRANASCASCHGCAEGTLLGAFSYTVVPRAAIPRRQFR